MDSSTSPVQYPGGNADNFFRKKNTTTISFAIGLLLFLLPFVQLNCGSVTVAENTGIGLATGTEWNISNAGGLNSIAKELNSSNSNSEREKMKLDPNWFLLLGIVFGIMGIIFSVSSLKIKHVASMSAGILAAVMLVAALVHLKILIRSQLPAANKNDSLGMDFGQLLKIKFTTWYFLSVAAFISASFFGYRHHLIEMKDAMDKEFHFEFQSEQEE